MTILEDKITLVLQSYPTHGIDLSLLVTIVKEFLRDDHLKATREEITTALYRMNPPTKKVEGQKRYFMKGSA